MFANNFTTIDFSKAFPSYLSWLFTSSVFPQVVSIVTIILAITIVLLILLSIIFFFLRLRKTVKDSIVYLEVRPTDKTLKSPLSTNQLFTLLHSLGRKQSSFEKLIGYKRSISLELVSTKQLGIRYILRVPKKDVSVIKKTLLAYLPGIETNEVCQVPNFL